MCQSSYHSHSLIILSPILRVYTTFASNGDTIVSDNGSCFTSKQSATFCTRNNINHVTLVKCAGKYPIDKSIHCFSRARKTTRKSSRKTLMLLYFGQEKKTSEMESHDNLDQLLNIDNLLKNGLHVKVVLKTSSGNVLMHENSLP